MTRKIKLYHLAHSRAGDKGEVTNISLFPYDESNYEILKAKVTADVVKKHFQGHVRGDVVRYEVPSLHGFNFVMYGTRPGGVAAALDLDSHGKGLCFGLLELEIDMP